MANIDCSRTISEAISLPEAMNQGDLSSVYSKRFFFEIRNIGSHMVSLRSNRNLFCDNVARPIPYMDIKSNFLYGNRISNSVYDN